MAVHARAVDAEERLRHEGGVQPLARGDRLQRRLEGDRVVGGAQGIGVLEVDLVLPGGDLVMRRLDLDPERLEVVHHLLADIGPEVLGEVEVAGRVVGQRLHPAVRAGQQEELELRTGVEDPAALLGAVELPTENVARIAGERVTVRREDVADDARTARLGRPATRVDSLLPGDRRKGRQVRDQEHVRLGDACEALDAAAVEPLAVLDRLLELVHRHLDRFDLAHDVGELQADEAQVALLGELQGGGEILVGHGVRLLSASLRVGTFEGTGHRPTRGGAGDPGKTRFVVQPAQPFARSSHCSATVRRMRILVTDGHYKHALGIVRALAPHHEVLVAAPRRLAMAAVSRHAAGRFVAPPSADHPRFLAWLDREVPRRRIEQVMPVSAAACELLASHTDRWPGTRIVLPSPDRMAQALDKRSTMAVAASVGIAVPRTAEPDSLEGLQRAAEEVSFPLVLKARLEGPSGVAYVDRPEDLRAAVEGWMTQNGSARLPLVQQRIVGPAFGVFATYQLGHCRRIMAHRRIREFPPTGGESSCCELATDPDAIDAGRRLLDALAWHGVAMVELKRHEADGRLYLMEVNPKFWGSLDLALAAGADFPGDLARIAGGEELSDQPPPTGPLRFCWPLGNDLRYLVARPGSWRRVLADWLGGARTNLRASDPLPHLVELAGTLGRMARG